MKEVHQEKYCENCKRNTSHIVRESALEIESVCTECHKEVDMVKTFF